jgi:acyl-CoA hydrolase
MSANRESDPGEDAPALPVVVGRGELDEVRPVAHSRVTMTQLMSPQDTNLFGSVFGGVILALVDKIAYVSATRHAGCPCVTVSFDQVDFNSPIQIGEIVTLEAAVATVGRTSLGVGVRVFAENVHGGSRRETNVCHVTMVATDEERHPVPVPKLRIETEDEYALYLEGEFRRESRLELERRRDSRRD